ncbi:MAG: ArdC family protein [Lawsonibacter sp.]|nr:ArdC family protein [Lawsonibacter sp.]
MLSKVRQALVQEFLSALHEEKIPWHPCWNTPRPVSLQTVLEYRGINNLSLSYLAMERGYTDPRWLTFQQVREHGWQVNKDEKSARVEFWHYYDKETRKVLESSEVRRIQREDPERMKNIRLSAYTYAVFNAQQVEGVPEWKRQWCDSLILCQEDHTLRDTLPPIVNKFSDQKAQQQENETKMMLPLQRALMMIGLTLVFIPLLRLASADWYGNLVNTFWGQLSLVATAIVVLMTLNKAIRLSKPIEYDV